MENVSFKTCLLYIAVSLIVMKFVLLQSQYDVYEIEWNIFTIFFIYFYGNTFKRKIYLKIVTRGVLMLALLNIENAFSDFHNWKLNQL